MKKQKISDAVIHRLPRYYRYLDDLYNKGVVRISSSSLGDKMDITASQIRQDLSCFGEFGQQGYGYNVAELRAEIGHILGIDNGHKLIIIGVGHLGHALLQNFDFDKVGFQRGLRLRRLPRAGRTPRSGALPSAPWTSWTEYVAQLSPQRGGADGAAERGPAPGGPAYRPGHPGLLELHQRGAVHRRSPACSSRTSTLWTPC